MIRVHPAVQTRGDDRIDALHQSRIELLATVDRSKPASAAVPTTDPVTQLGTRIEYETPDGDTWNVYLRGRTIGSLSSDRLGFAHGPITVDADTTALQWESPSETILLIALTDPGTGRSVRLTIGDNVLSPVPLVRPPGTEVSLAIVTFSEIARFHVDLLDDLGTPVRVLSP